MFFARIRYTRTKLAERETPATQCTYTRPPAHTHTRVERYKLEKCAHKAAVTYAHTAMYLFLVFILQYNHWWDCLHKRKPARARHCLEARTPSLRALAMKLYAESKCWSIRAAAWRKKGQNTYIFRFVQQPTSKKQCANASVFVCRWPCIMFANMYTCMKHTLCISALIRYTYADLPCLAQRLYDTSAYA
jgi:hypothetical protein